MGKILHKLLKVFVKELKNFLHNLGESCSEVSHFILEPRNFHKSQDYQNMSKRIKISKHLINNYNFLMDDPDKGDPATPCIYVYKEKIQSDGSLDTIKLRTVLRGYLQNKEMIGDT